jgi:hypothetical protein
LTCGFEFVEASPASPVLIERELGTSYQSPSFDSTLKQSTHTLQPTRLVARQNFQLPSLSTRLPIPRQQQQLQVNFESTLDNSVHTEKLSSKALEGIEAVGSTRWSKGRVNSIHLSSITSRFRLSRSFLLSKSNRSKLLNTKKRTIGQFRKQRKIVNRR